MPRTILLNPGPVRLSPGVRAALTNPDLCHRESEFFDLQDEVRRQLLAVYDLDEKEWAPVLIPGSGTAAVEAMIGSLIPREHSELLIVINGVYGQRIKAIADILNIKSSTLDYPYGDKINLDDIEYILNTNHTITHLAMIHHETTTGRLNQLDELTHLCNDRNIKLLIDAVSSFGAEEIDFDEPSVTACAAAANKCLHGAPGLALVMLRRSALLEMKCAPHRSLYLDIDNYLHHQDKRSTPFTPPVHLLYALHQAIFEYKQAGGRQARHHTYQKFSLQIRRGLLTLGIKPFLPRAADSSVVLSAYHLPENICYDSFHDQLKQAGFIIYAGQGAFSGQLFRVSTMGDITEDDLMRLLDHITMILRTK